MNSLKTGLALIVLAAMTGQAYAGEMCDPGAAAALKTAAVQQEMMVAGLTCHDDAQYNRFVLGFRPELQKSDAELMAWFRNRDGNEAGYDSYKTKLANLAAGQEAHDNARYCASVRHDFATAKGSNLGDFVANAHLLIAAPEACAIKFDRVAVAGVPSYQLPAAPYGAAPYAAAPYAAAPPRSVARAAYDPPATRQGYADEQWNDGYAYGPPPGWARRAQRTDRYGRPYYGYYYYGN